MLQRLLPKISIHCWGGLGSQLYSLSIMNTIKNKFKWRQVFLVSHENGVTHRTFELTDFLPLNSIKEILDFSPHVSNKKITLIQITKSSVYLFISWIAQRFGFLARCNSGIEAQNLRPWILQLRGHYSDLEISDENLKYIVQIIWPDFSDKPNSFFKLTEQVAIHYRLGDLMKLNSKQPINASRIQHGLDLMNSKTIIEQLHIFSDSIVIAQNTINSFGCEFKCIPQDLEIIPALFSLIGYKGFVATPSKISEWVLIFRSYLKIDGLSFVPIEMYNHLVKVYPKIDADKNVFIY